MRLITHSSSSVSPLPSYLLHTLRRVLPSFHAETDSGVRNEFSTIMKKLFSRMQGVIYRLTRGSAGLQDSIKQLKASVDFSSSEHAESLQNHTEFLTWYTKLLLHELQPTASYPRHISALKVLQLLNTSGLYSVLQDRSLNLSDSPRTSRQVDLYTTSFVHLLLELVIDPFDDVRNIATLLLREYFLIGLAKSAMSHNTKLMAPSIGYVDLPLSYSAVEVALQRSTAMSYRTGRADHADGVGRLYHLQYTLCGKDAIRKRRFMLDTLVSGLEIDIQVLQNSLQTAIASATLHGHLLALR